MTVSLEEQLTASIAIANAQKAVPRTEALPPGTSESEDPAATRRADLFLMPKPPPPSSEVPTRLSPSSVNTFLHDCSLKWYYRKVLKLPETRGAALGLGTAVHTALIENFRQKIETREDLDVSGTQALFVYALIEQLDEIKLQKDESADDLKEAGEVMVRVYMEQAAPAIEPAAIEEHVEGFIGDVAVHGYIDILDVDGRVIDIKTAKKKPAGMMPSYRLQVGTYAMLEPRSNGTAQLSTLTKTKTVALHQETIAITPADRKLTTKLYSIARDQMVMGIVAPNRTSFLCSRKYCSHWQRCEAEYGGQVAGEAGE